MPSVTLKNCCDSIIGVIVFNPADVVRGVDAGQFLINPGDSQQLETSIPGTNFSVGICYDTYYRWSDDKFACFWGTTVDSHGVRGNWMKYRLFHIENEDVDSTVCVNNVSYCTDNGDGIILARQNGQHLQPEPFSDQQYREVSLGFLLSMLAPLMGRKQEGEITMLGALILARISKTALTIKDMALLACGFLRLYHLQQTKGSSIFQTHAARHAGQYVQDNAPVLEEKGHQVASQIRQKGTEFRGNGQKIGSKVADKGHQLASQVGQQGQSGQLGEQVQQLSDAVLEFLRSIGLEGALDKVTSGDLTARDVENIVVMLLKLSGASDYNIEQLYSELGMDPHVLFDCWWKGTQGHIEGGPVSNPATGAPGFGVNRQFGAMSSQPATAKHGLETKPQPMDLSNQENLGISNVNKTVK